MKSKKWILLITIVALILFVGILFYGFILAPRGAEQGQGKPIIPAYILTISILVLIIGLIPLFYYIIHRSIENKFEQNLKIISNVIEDEKKDNSLSEEPVNCANLIQKFLSYNEKKVVNKLIEQKGTALQSEISRMESLGKVKTHRAVQDLEKKGIISIERYGNTNRISLTKDLKKIFIK